jgi:MFS family permease
MASGRARPDKAERRRRHAEREQRRADSKRFEKRVTGISLGLILGGPVLGVGVAALGAAEVYPSDDAMTVATSVTVVLVGLGFLVAACAGMYVMGGWRAAPFGAIFVAGFGGLIYGLVEADNAWRDVGVVLLMISCGSFWVVPALFSPRVKAKPRKRRPATTQKSAGLGSAFVTGAVTAVVGHAIDVWWVLLFGAMSVGTVAGGGIVMWLEDHRYKQDQAGS